MADPNSPIFKAFEVIGLITGKLLKYTIGVTILALIGVKLRGSPSKAPMQSSPAGPPGAI